MQPSTSRTIGIMRLPLIILIILIHSYIPVTNLGVFNFSQTLISQVVARIAVPLFFLISGFLFFRGKHLTSSIFTQKIKSRFSTLVVPYFLWNIIVFVLFLLIQNTPIFSNFSHGNVPDLLKSDIHVWLNYFFYSPIATQFWFIRDLIILVLLSPLWYVSIKYLKYFLLVCFVGFWLINPSYRFINLNYEGLLFFYFGAYLSYHKLNPILRKQWFIILSILYVSLSLLDTIGYIYDYQYSYQFHKISLLFGILLFVNISYRLRDGKLSNILLQLSPYSFILFALHEPFMSFVKRILSLYFSYHNDFKLFMIYTLTVLITIAVSVIIILILKKILPKFYNLLSGNRKNVINGIK